MFRDPAPARPRCPQPRRVGALFVGRRAKLARMKGQNLLSRMSRAFLLAVTLLLFCQLNAARAGRYMGWSATIPAGETTTTKNLLWSGPARNRDRKYLIQTYSVRSSAPVELVFTVTRLDGSSESFTVPEGRNDAFDRVFVGGILDLRITRLSSDKDQAIFVRGTLYTCTEGESRCLLGR
jgi:hypothetical protein